MKTVKIEHAPGHTNGHVFYHFSKNKLAFVGDIVFPMGCGRIFEGSTKEMYESVVKIKHLVMILQYTQDMNTQFQIVNFV